MPSKFEFQHFAIQGSASSLDPWEILIAANGGPSAECITGAPGNGHETFMCCLLAPEAPRKKRLREEPLLSNAPWAGYYERIAILVPVAVQDGIVLAQGIKRLHKTCPLTEKGLGLKLLAHVSEHFRNEYLFLSPVCPFADHLQRQLYLAGVPYGRYGYRSLESLFRETAMDDARTKASWLRIKEATLLHTKKDEFLRSDAMLLTITPQPCPKIFVEYCAELKGQRQLAVRSYIAASPPPGQRTLLLNERFCTQPEESDPEYKPPPELPGAHDFLWHMAGDGLMVVHGPSLAAAFA